MKLNMILLKICKFEIFLSAKSFQIFFLDLIRWSYIPSMHILLFHFVP